MRLRSKIQDEEIETESLTGPYQFMWYKDTAIPLINGRIISLESRLCDLVENFQGGWGIVPLELDLGELVVYDGEYLCGDAPLDSAVGPDDIDDVATEDITDPDDEPIDLGDIPQEGSGYVGPMDPVTKDILAGTSILDRIQQMGQGWFQQ